MGRAEAHIRADLLGRWQSCSSGFRENTVELAVRSAARGFKTLPPLRRRGKGFTGSKASVFTAYCRLPAAYSNSNRSRRTDVQSRRSIAVVESVPYHDLRDMHGFARHWRHRHRGKWSIAPRLSGSCLLITRQAGVDCRVLPNQVDAAVPQGRPTSRRLHEGCEDGTHREPAIFAPFVPSSCHLRGKGRELRATFVARSGSSTCYRRGVATIPSVVRPGRNGVGHRAALIVTKSVPSVTGCKS